MATSPLLPEIISGNDKSRLLLVRHDLSQSPFGILRALLANATGCLIVVRVLHASARWQVETRATVVDLDWTQRIPGFSENSSETSKSLQDTLLHAIGAAPAGPLTAAIDSLDTLAEDLGSHASAARLVQSVITLLETRPAGSRLILPLLAPSSIAPHLSAFRPRTELILHAPHLLRHLAKDYSTPPSNMRIWTLLPQLAARREGERLVDGSPNVHGVAVVEVIKPERKGVARVLEVWADGQAYRIDRLGLGAALPEAQPVQPQPDAGLSFKLSMTPDEQAARSQVALPYAHTRYT